MPHFRSPMAISRVLLVAFCILAGAVPFLTADVVVTLDGRELSGRIVEETAAAVRIQTPAGGVLQIPRDRIREVRREEISYSEAEGDQFFDRGEHYRALRSYEKARDESGVSAQIEEKIRRVRDEISRRENSLYQALFTQAQALSTEGKHKAAREPLCRIVEAAGPESLSACRARRAIAFEYFLESLDLRDLVRYSDAIQTLEKAVETDDSVPMIHYHLARLYRDYSGDVQKAVGQYERAIAVGKQVREMEEADREQFADLEPSEIRFRAADLSEMRYELAELFYRAGRKEEAAGQFQSLLDDGAEGLPTYRV
ncbi:tetratricopeptide repeat protein, partial [bacterium]|nr:tetratricopeptide repeat protein [bacterium]